MLIGLSLFLTFFVMAPVVDQINANAVQPYMAGTIETTEALTRASVPLKKFMLGQTRESDIATFVRITGGSASTSRRTCRCRYWCRPSPPAN